MKPAILLICALLGLTTLDKKVQRKIISDTDYNYVFYVSLEDISHYEYDKEYYWYKSGEIHTSKGGSNGDILHGNYTKTHKKNTLTVQGNFHKGLKHNLWKYWYPNGNLQEITEWKKGYKTGQNVFYSEDGKVIKSGSYKNNRKEGRWIDYKTKDTFYYKAGIRVGNLGKIYKKKDGTVVKKKTFKKRMKLFFNKLFSKKTKDSTNTRQRKRKSSKIMDKDKKQ